VPGYDDGWSLVHFPTPTFGSHQDTPANPPENPRNRRWRRSRVLAVASVAVLLALVGGGTAVAEAHKTVTLDVDGELVTVSTFAGSVTGLLADRGVAVGPRDAVSPSGALAEGSQVVVRHAHRITVSRDGEQEQVWTTALAADEALDTLARRDGGPVALVASRSGGRAELPLELTLDGPADVIVDGTTTTVHGSSDAAGTLARLGIALQPLDLVSVQRASGGRVQLVVQRVVVQDVTTTLEVPFASSSVEDASRYTGTTTVRQAGVPGVRTVVETVTTIDGVETARVLVSDAVTAAPVDEVVAVGTRARPASTPAARVSGDIDALNWAALAACESGGRVDAVSRNGLYHGLYQFSVGTWAGVGGSGLPSQASAEEQTARAKALYARSGAGPWPHCGPRLFT